MINTSDDIGELAGAMAKAQAAIANPTKTRENAFFKNGAGKPSKYADLATGLSVIRPALSAQNLAVFQVTHIEQDRVFVFTRIVHSSGQWIESRYPVSVFVDQQKMAAALTYARRNSLFALVGIAGEEDDDDGGDPSNSKLISEAQVVELHDLIEETKSNGAVFLSYFKIKDIAELPASRYMDAISMLHRKRKAS